MAYHPIGLDLPICLFSDQTYAVFQSYCVPSFRPLNPTRTRNRILLQTHHIQVPYSGQFPGLSHLKNWIKVYKLLDNSVAANYSIFKILFAEHKVKSITYVGDHEPNLFTSRILRIGSWIITPLTITLSRSCTFPLIFKTDPDFRFVTFFR